MGRRSALTAAAWLALSPAAAAPLTAPGATWGSLSRDLSGFEGYGAQGWVKQGLEWTRLPGDIPVKTFAAYRWRARTQHRPFYNSHGPAVILELSKSVADLGLDFSWQRFPERGRSVEQHELYASWYKRWDLRRAGGSFWCIPFAGLPLSSWGRLAHDLEGVEGNGAQGWLSQGVEWVRLGGWAFRTQAAYRWRLRSKERTFYNVHGPTVGAEVGGRDVDFGLEYAWRDYPDLRRKERALQLYVNWFYAWTLRR